MATPLLVAPWLFPSTAHVGSDGIHVGRAWNRRFIPASDILSVERHQAAIAEGREDEGASLVIRRRSGAMPITLPLTGSAFRIDDIRERLLQAAKRAQASDAAMIDALARAGRPIASWRLDLAALVHGATFRRAAVSVESLERVMNDPTAKNEQRVGAALALGALDDRARQRVRVAAEASARPRLRVVLSSIARTASDGDSSLSDDAILAAIAEDEAGHAERGADLLLVHRRRDPSD